MTVAGQNEMISSCPLDTSHKGGVGVLLSEVLVCVIAVQDLTRMMPGFCRM